MDSEMQPLLRRSAPDVRRRRSRPLTQEEVLQVRQEVVWRRVQFCLVIMFWAIIAMFLAIITCILMQSQCSEVVTNEMPSVPPVHLSLAPLITKVYAL